MAVVTAGRDTSDCGAGVPPAFAEAIAASEFVAAGGASTFATAGGTPAPQEAAVLGSTETATAVTAATTGWITALEGDMIAEGPDDVSLGAATALAAFIPFPSATAVLTASEGVEASPVAAVAVAVVAASAVPAVIAPA